MQKIKGRGGSTGIAIGKSFVLPSWDLDFPDVEIDVTDLANEFERFYDVIHQSKDEIKAIKREISPYVSDEEKAIFDTHLAILEDPSFMSEVQGIIERQYKAAEVAVKEVIDKFVAMFNLLDDEYMKERAIDIKDVGNRLLKHLIGAPEVKLPEDNKPFILVADELAPSQLAQLNPNHVQGIVTMSGGRDSHSAIIARSMGIPLVLGIESNLANPIHTGDLLVIDGDEGWVFINPDAETVLTYQTNKIKRLEQKAFLRDLIHVPAVTVDGKSVALLANINSLREIDDALEFGAEGIGLFRTEFLYMGRSSLPSEDEQFDVYRQAAQRLGNRPLTIRTFDIGGDKELEYLSLPEEDNPFLGYRAIRISLDRVDLFKTQLRAILRASVFGNVKVMYPMISSLEEVRKANEILAQAKQELAANEIPFNAKIETGIMIEVPAAVAIADLLAQEVDFFSIGTNDLVQFVLAVDRMNEKIAPMYEPYHPAIVRMLKQTVEAAQLQGIPVSVCGELAGDLQALTIWLGLGVHQLSVTFQSLLEVKHAILNSDATNQIERFQRVLKCQTSGEIQEILQSSGVLR